MKTCETCGSSLASYRDNATPPQEHHEVVAPKKPRFEFRRRLAETFSWLPSIKEDFIDVFQGAFTFLKWALIVTVILTLVTVVPHLVGHWLWLHVFGWDAPTDWGPDPKPIVNWLLGSAVLMGWFPLMCIGRKVRADRAEQEEKLRRGY